MRGMGSEPALPALAGPASVETLFVRAFFRIGSISLIGDCFVGLRFVFAANERRLRSHRPDVFREPEPSSQ